MTAPQAGDDFTELVDADIPRVDLVGKAANGTRFLIAKAAEDGHLTQPLVPADMVRDLLAKAEEAAPVTAPAAADDDVAKADLDVTDAPAPDQLIPDAPGGSTAATVPGSADWEQLDGDTALNAVATLGRVKACLSWLAGREAQESVTGDGDPYDAWNLEDAACQLDWIIGQLAAFAVGEHMEADSLEQVGKAAAEVAAPVAVVEKLAPVVKAGRSLSASNEAELRAAAASIQKVLDSLPAAPAADDVTKTEETPAVPASVAEPVDVLAKALAALPGLSALTVAETLLAGGRTQEVAKAKGDPQMAVFSADGKLVGVIDPADLNPIAATEAPAAGDTEGAGDEEAPADDSDGAPVTDPAAAEDSAVIPGTSTVQAPTPAPEDDQTPAVAKAADPAQLEELRTQFADEVRKNADLADVVKALQEQVRKYGLTPDDRNSPHLNGATGAAGVVARDGGQVDGFADLRKAVSEARTEPQRVQAQADLTLAEIKARIEAARG